MAEQPEKNFVSLVSDVATPLVEAMGLIVWGIEISSAGKSHVQVYIESPHFADESTLEHEQMLCDIAKCEQVSRSLSLALDVEDIFQDAWILEVSTPGLDRTFFHLEQMRPFIGDVVAVNYRQAPLREKMSQKRFSGVLREVGDDFFVLATCRITEDDRLDMTGSEDIVLPWKGVQRAHRRALFPRPVKPGKNSKK